MARPKGYRLSAATKRLLARQQRGRIHSTTTVARRVANAPRARRRGRGAGLVDPPATE